MQKLIHCRSSNAQQSLRDLCVIIAETFAASPMLPLLKLLFQQQLSPPLWSAYHPRTRCLTDYCAPESLTITFPNQRSSIQNA